MPLTEESFTALVDAGCPACPSKRLAIEALVVQRLPLLDGEPYGAPSWGYKGEDLVRGTFRISCRECQRELFAVTDCPRCGAADGVARAMEEENAAPLPTACACGSKLLTALAYVPAEVEYEGKRANKARTQTAPEDPGFHTLRVECKECGKVAELRAPCPLCGGAG